MKEDSIQIVSLLQAYPRESVLKAMELYNENDQLKQKLLSDGYMPGPSKPINCEFYFIDNEYWFKPDYKKEFEIGFKKRKIKLTQRSNKKTKSSADLKRVKVKCPECQGKMYKQAVCPKCSAGRDGYKIRLICEENPDHEVLL